MAGQIGPEYRQLMDQIRSKIASGEYPVGQPIPSTTELKELTGMSIPVIRRAVGQLEADGILEGHPGKAVYVKATPTDLASERQDVQALGEQIRSLQRDVRELAGRATDEAQPSDVVRELTEFRETISRLEANLVGLYQKTGHAYPQGGSHDTTKPASKRGQPKR